MAIHTSPIDSEGVPTLIIDSERLIRSLAMFNYLKTSDEPALVFWASVRVNYVTISPEEEDVNVQPNREMKMPLWHVLLSR
jgi:hypothetical protein